MHDFMVTHSEKVLCLNHDQLFDVAFKMFANIICRNAMPVFKYPYASMQRNVLTNKCVMPLRSYANGTLRPKVEFLFGI